MINTKNIKKIINKTPRAKANGVLSTSTDSCFIHRLKSVVFAEEFNKPNFKKCFSKKKFIFSVGFIILIVIIFSGLGFYFSNRIYPGVEVLGINLGGKKTDEASHLLSQKINTPEKLELFSEEKVFDISLSDISFNYDFNKTANHAYQIHRNRSWQENFLGKFTSVFKTNSINITYSIDSERLDEYLQIVSEQVLSEPTYPSVEFEEGKLSIESGSSGEVLDKNTLLLKLENKILSADFSRIKIPLIKIDPSLTDEESKLFKERAEKYLGKSFQLKNEYDNYFFNEKVIFSFLDYYEQFNDKKISDFIETEVAPNIERPPQNAVLRFENEKVTEFSPAKDGLSIEKEKLAKEIIDNLALLKDSEDKSFSTNIPVIKASPDVSLSEVNNLGIKELLGRGFSKFRSSITGRIHNISLASSKFNGVLIAPGETFSFNKTLGDVSALTGYKQAYIIKDGRTVLGDGGGVCQVSTTLFRAALDTGLPINERRAHSYRVSYYEQDSSPGLDATVFDPTTDLKFTNDTPAHLLIQTLFDAGNYSLIFEIYGTNDERIAEISKPVITSSVVPPEDLYIDDPSLPEGIIKQIDYKAWGAKVVFDYFVVRKGEKFIEETYVSNYRPWQAVFLRGTGPAI